MNIRNNQVENKILILYEHPEWFLPLFAELDRRGSAFEQALAHRHAYNPTEWHSPHAIVVNRMSPSAHTRGHEAGIHYTLQYLAFLKEIGANVLNGYDAFRYEISKARQLTLFERLGINYPRSMVINHSTKALETAEQIGYPLLIKPDIGGSGAGIVRFDTKQELSEAIESNEINLGAQKLALVQEYLPARGESIIRVEVMNGKFLYAIRIFLSEGEFNLCPADYCVPGEGVKNNGNAGPEKLVEAYQPPKEIIEQVLAITQAANIDVGGVEYLINDIDGRVTFYDINVLSNFVADAPNVVGFDPFPKFVDFMLARANIVAT